MDTIVNQLVSSFDFSIMLIVNVITYIAIKIIDDINKEKVVTTWQKRIVFLISAIIVSVIYIIFTDVKVNIVINSIIIAPVAWSWLAKPIANKLGIDYKKHN